jgi:hypothetical protein
MPTRRTAPEAGKSAGRRPFELPVPVDLLPPAIAARLRAAGILNCDAWLTLTPQERCAIWGITRAMALEITALVSATRAVRQLTRG